MRHKVTISNTGESVGSGGDIVFTATLPATAWAAIEPFAGREYVAGDQLRGVSTHRIVMRYEAGVTDGIGRGYTISLGIRSFDVLDVRNVEERDRMISVIVEERDQ